MSFGVTHDREKNWDHWAGCSFRALCDHYCLDRSERTTAGDVRCFLVDPGPDSAGHFCDSKATLWPEINAEHSILIE